MPALLLLLLISALAWGHPFGTELYGHRLEVRLDRGSVQLDYLAEISTVDHLRDLRGFLSDVDRPTAQDEARYIERVLDELETGLDVYVDGEPLHLQRLETDEPSGRGDTRFTNFRLRLAGDLSPDARTLNVVNGNLPGAPALYSTELLVTDAVIVDACSLFQVEGGKVVENQAGRWLDEAGGRELRVSFRLRSDTGEAVQRGFRRLASGGELEQWVPAESRLDGVDADPLLELVRGEVTPPAVALGLLAAVVLGVLHGLSPGHGKALVAAYLVGSRRSALHAVALGLIVTLTHTLTVYVMGVVAWVLAESFSPEKVLPWLELASGVLIVGVGLGLVRSRAREWRAARPSAHAHEHEHEHAAPMHEHAHDHGGDAHAHGQAHAHAYSRAGDEGWRSLVALGISGGLAPCPSALVLLLTAIGLQRIGLGLVLVFAFSLGLAVLVSGLGIAVILLGDRLQDLPAGRPAVRLLPVLSAVLVTMLGLGLSWKGVLSVLAAVD